MKFKDTIDFFKGLNQTDQFGYIQPEDLLCGFVERSRTQQKSSF